MSKSNSNKHIKNEETVSKKTMDNYARSLEDEIIKKVIANQRNIFKNINIRMKKF